MGKNYFENYGELEYLEAEDYFAGNWSYYGEAKDKDGESWGIAISGDKTELRYGAF